MQTIEMVSAYAGLNNEQASQGKREWVQPGD